MISKLILKFLKTKPAKDFIKNKESKLGENFRIGNFCTVSVYKSAQFISGNNISIRNYCHFYIGKNAKLIIDDSVFMNNYCSINVMEYIEIGENTLFGEGVKLYDHNHEYGYDSAGNFKVQHQKFKNAAIKIGKNCWLGSNVTVLKGVRIGDNCIIGAGCTIYKDVPDNSILVNSQNLMTK